MKTKFFLAVGTALSWGALLFSGCGGGSDGGTTAAGPAISSTPSAITSTDGAAKAALSGVTVMEGGYDLGSSTSSFQTFGSGGIAKETAAVADSTRINLWMQRLAKDAAPLRTAINWQTSTAKVVAMDVSSICTTSGTATIDSSQSGGSITYNNCRTGAIQLNGTITISGASSNGTSATGNYSIGTAANPFVTTFYTGSTSSIKDSEERTALTMNNLSYNTATMSISATLNGSNTSENFTAKTKSETTVFNLTSGYTFASGVKTVNITGGSVVNKEYTTVNGAYALQTSEGVSFQNFKVDRDFTALTYSVNGTFAIQNTPSKCIDGTFNINTTTPINAARTAGVMTINGNTTVMFNADGTVTVTVTGIPARTFASLSDLNAVCTDFSI